MQQFVVKNSARKRGFQVISQFKIGSVLTCVYYTVGIQPAQQSLTLLYGQYTVISSAVRFW
jgi:hypothetical protein